MARFAEITEATAALIIADKNAKSTQKSTNGAWTTLKNWCSARGKVFDEMEISKADLDKHLYKFYFEVRKQDGTMYSQNGYRAIRHGLQRKFKELRQFDIINDVEFVQSNNSFNALSIRMKKVVWQKLNIRRS